MTSKTATESYNPFASHNKGYIMSMGSKIYYHSYGIGIPIIMLHGNNQNSKIFKNQVALLQHSFRVILVDSRGHGASDFGELRLSLDILTDDIQNLIDQLGLHQVILFGFSDGGNIALKLAQRIPQKILVAIAISPNLNPEGFKKPFIISIKLAHSVCLKLSFIKWFNKKAQILSLMITESTLSKKSLALIQIPVLIFSGEYDIIHIKHIHMIGRLIPQSKLIIIKKTGHNLLRKRGLIIHHHMLRFLKSYSIDH